MGDETATDAPPVSEMETLKRECQEMVTILKKLDREQLNLKRQNQILARECLSCGYQPNLLEPPPPKRRRPAATKKKETKAEASSPK
mmetsp:Transcript_12583/g.17856  ORF Transcript_12583/g.17856 Transcript_12583/m.17856 type:complete len:87 (+) Transcript_12583:112-372(+)